LQTTSDAIPIIFTCQII